MGRLSVRLLGQASTNSASSEVQRYSQKVAGSLRNGGASSGGTTRITVTGTDFQPIRSRSDGGVKAPTFTPGRRVSAARPNGRPGTYRA